MDVNPYLSIAASLACGYLGLMERREPRDEYVGDAYASAEGIPSTLASALDILERADQMQEVLGRDFCRTYIRVKRTENDAFLQVISPWEREHLLLNV